MPNRCQDSRHSIGSEMTEKKWFLGYLKGTKKSVYLKDFEWECDWYWGGGYIGNSSFHAHFDGAFLKVPDIRGHCLNSKNACFIIVKTIVFTYLCGMKKDQIQTLPPLSVTLSLEEYQGLLDRLRLSEQKDLEYVQKILENEQTIRAKEQEILDKKQ